MIKKKILITGATSGLGKYLAGQARQKHELIIVGRNMNKMEDYFPDSARYRADLSSISEVKRAAEQISEENEHLDLLICNAGMLGAESFTKTPEGIEQTLAVNYLSHYILLATLWGKLTPGSSKVIMIGSASAAWYPVNFSDPESEQDYRPLKAYGRSKAMLMMLGKWIHDEWGQAGPIPYIVDPGTFSSGIARSRARWFQFIYGLASWAMSGVENAGSEVINLIEGANYPPGKIIKKGKVKDLVFSREEISNLMHMSRTLTGCDLNRMR
jgi:NAD(P)-dependent dehydrogenase (short-subunit alcohol dehydrogenase family)